MLRRALLLISLVSTPAHAIVVAGTDPNALRVVGSNDFFGTFSLSGVVMVFTNFGSCSGALLSDGVSILTAGHCVAPAFGETPYGNPNVKFMGPSNNGPGTGGYQDAAVAAVLVNPGWDSDPSHGGDLAIMRLAAPAPAFATRYSLFTGLPTFPTDTLLIAGFGFGGTGITGADSADFPIDGSLRAGNNIYAGDGTLRTYSPNLLLGQFYDSSNPSSNTFGLASPYSNSSGTEVDIAPGDSGGPSFLNGQIIGVHDVVDCIVDPVNKSLCKVPPSNNTAVGSYFGEIFGDTSVPGNAAWIASQEVDTPEPATACLLIAGLAIVARRMRHT